MPPHSKAATHFVASQDETGVHTSCGKTLKPSSGTDEGLAQLLGISCRICKYCLGKAACDLK
eukprot:3227908-Karenia_brevis.AAC.1